MKTKKLQQLKEIVEELIENTESGIITGYRRGQKSAYLNIIEIIDTVEKTDKGPKLSKMEDIQARYLSDVVIELLNRIEKLEYELEKIKR